MCVFKQALRRWKAVVLTKYNFSSSIQWAQPRFFFSPSWLHTSVFPCHVTSDWRIQTLSWFSWLELSLDPFIKQIDLQCYVFCFHYSEYNTKKINTVLNMHAKKESKTDTEERTCIAPCIVCCPSLWWILQILGLAWRRWWGSWRSSESWWCTHPPPARSLSYASVSKQFCER